MEGKRGKLKLMVIYICVGLFVNSVRAKTDTSETSSEHSSSDKTLTLAKREADNFGIYDDLDKREDEEISEVGEVDDNLRDSFDFNNLNNNYRGFVDEPSFLGDDSEADSMETDDEDVEKRLYGFEDQLDKRGPMGFMSQLGKRNFGFPQGQSPVGFIDQPGRRGPMGFWSQLGKRSGPMGFYSQLGKRSPMGFMSQLGKRAPMGFLSQLGKRGPMGFMSQLGKRGRPMGFISQLGRRSPYGFMSQLGKRSGPMGFYAQLGKRGAPMGFYSQLGKRSPMGFMSQLGKRSPMGFMSQLGKRQTPAAFFSQLGKRAPMGFLSQLGKRGGPMGFMSQLGKRSDTDDIDLTNEVDSSSNQPLARRKRNARAIPWEVFKQRLAQKNRYVRPYNRFGFRGRMGKRYPGYSFFSQLG